MKPDIAMEKGYSVVRDKSQDRYASSEDEMAFNQSQVLQAAGKESSFAVEGVPNTVNPTKNPAVKVTEWS